MSLMKQVKSIIKSRIGLPLDFPQRTSQTQTLTLVVKKKHQFVFCVFNNQKKVANFDSIYSVLVTFWLNSVSAH